MSSSAGSATGTHPTKPRRRTPVWDNARLGCIVLVVLGHAVQRLTYDSDIALGLYLLIYAFHMPLFAIISGYFSKSDPPSRRQMTRVLTDIVAPYIIFESLWTLTQWLVEGQANPNPTQPSWTLWFLVALAIFRIVLPYLALLRWPLVWTVAISVGAGYLPNIDSTFSLARTLGLLPFFTLGWWLSHHQVLQRRGFLERPRWAWRTLAFAVLLVAGIVAWAFVDLWQDVNLRNWLFYDANYSAIGGTQWWAGGVRLLLMGIALVLSIAFFTLMPRRGYGFTRWGQYTMYIYLLHSFVLYPFRESGVLRGLDPTWIWLPVVILLSIAVTFFLGSAPVRFLFRPLIEPRPRWLFAEPAHIGSAARRNDPTGSRRTDTGTHRHGGNP